VKTDASEPAKQSNNNLYRITSHAEREDFVGYSTENKKDTVLIVAIGTVLYKSLPISS
jgi:hypothetical protein